MQAKKFFLLLGCASIILFSLKSYFVVPTYEIHHQSQVHNLIAGIKPDEMWRNLETLTRFSDRAASHGSGAAAASWIKQNLDVLAQHSGRHDISIYTIATQNNDVYGNRVTSSQPSIIFKMGTSLKPAVILGAHLDTRPCLKLDGTDDSGCRFDKTGPYPGADDDGTGSVTLLELARTLTASNIQFKNPVYLIWYAAEETGRIGSKSVVADFSLKHIPVAAVMQLDMTGYKHQRDSSLWFDDSHTDRRLTTFCRKLVAAYINQPSGVIHGKAGESDNWSWSEAGYKTVFPFESDCHNSPECPRRQHTNADTMDKLSLDRMTDYLKLALAFTVELSDPVNAADHLTLKQ
jgi:leucyl aminopeptidase